MNRNQESHFSNLPEANILRSRFDLAQDVKFTANFGDLVPFYIAEVLPSDTFEIDTSKVCRLQTLVTPVMDNMCLDTYYFFVPHRLVWDHWEEFCGENKSGAWYPQVEYSIPQIKFPNTNDGKLKACSILDYMGVPTGVKNFSVNALPLRSYIKIYNDWFRDENLIAPVLENKGDTDVTYSAATNLTTAGGALLKAAKTHDYFTSALPGPQKGESPAIPVYGNSSAAGLPVLSKSTPFYPSSASFSPFPTTYRLLNADDDASARFSFVTSQIVIDEVPSTAYPKDKSVNEFPSGVSTSNKYLWPNNLYATAPSKASLAGNATPLYLDITDLRYASAVQRLLELEARGGSRYIELIRSHFGTVSPDARLQRSEYLGGNRIPISIHQVQNQAKSANGYLGDLGAMSLTTDNHSDFTKSFTEHGFIIGIAVARIQGHGYQQGLHRLWSRKTKYNYYWPVFANISEQPILNKEIYLQGSDEDDEVFGYQESFAEYRYAPDRVAGEMRSNYATSLDSWHLADDYASLPSLSEAWIEEDKTTVDRVLAVTSAVSNQLFFDFYIDCVATRPLPMFGVPGLGGTL